MSANKTVNKARDRELIYGYIKEARLYGHTLDELSIILDRPPMQLADGSRNSVIRGKLFIQAGSAGLVADVWHGFTPHSTINFLFSAT